MLLKKFATLAAASALALGSVASAHPLSLVNSPAARASADTGAASQLTFNDRTTRLAVLAAIALLIVAGIALFDDDDGPDSP